MSSLNFKQIALLKLLLGTDGIGPAKARAIIAKAGSIENILDLNYHDLLDVEGISDQLARRTLSSKNEFNNLLSSLDKEFNQLEKLNCKFISYWDKDYPSLLKKIYDPPLYIYVKGILSEDDQYSVAVVGTRTPTNYGKIQAEKISSELASQNITVISGLARGIDSAAHRGALAAKGRTLAVIGSGLDVIYPPENKNLFDEIAEKGAVISEFDLGTKPDATNFPRRNRIIAGLSLGVLVVESGIVGGALQTASIAVNENREVFAVPGNIGIKQSEGTNELIKRGEAKLITTQEDIIRELEIKLKPVVGKNIPKPEISLNMFEEKIMQTLDNSPKHIDTIADLSGMSSSDCLVYLLSLEFKGAVKQLPGKMFIAI
ncbi:MAG TPA: DNA-processing protein DprA [Ignavibacteriales bacterium]|nr:DNA-processing protein DprA [Ignavibacteriales bacterium]